MKICWIVLISLVGISRAWATGYFGPMVYLDDGGKNVDASPEFYWDLELKRLSREFKVPEAKLVKPKPTPNAGSDDATKDYRAALAALTAEAEKNDFDSAVSNGEIRQSDAGPARQQHEQARQVIASLTPETVPPLPQEYPSEFADYDRGAYAFRQGPAHYNEAREAWQALLKRPAQERKYRSVWATFMLGKVALKNGDFAEAVNWFQQTRDLAGRGFVDSLGLAADSYGWEGRAEWKQDHASQAAKLFLAQLSLGDESAVVSLKALIPDRDPVEGMLNYNVVESEPNADQSERPAKKLSADQELTALDRAVKDPLLRRLITVHILATGSAHGYFSPEVGQAANRAKRWLDVIKAANLSKLEDAEYLGWIAYQRGDYKDAAHWLKLADGKAPAALWLQAKLARRDGKIAEAAQAMAAAWDRLRDERAYTGWTGQPELSDYFDATFGYVFRGEEPSWSIPQQAAGDFGAFKLQRTDFVQALDMLFKGDLWNDAAYVAERVLSTDELKQYVDELPAGAASPAPSPPELWHGANAEATPEKLRYLLGRRLVREDRYDEAAKYLKTPYDQLVKRYADLLHQGGDQRLSKNDRALALFRAAWIARYEGMELMGSEMAPDGFTEDGQFPVPDLAKQRLTGKVEEVNYSDESQKPKIVPAVLKATPQEAQRLTKSKVAPDVRFHYRVIAGALAMKAATLLPNNAEETADAINMAGRWTADRDNKLADKYFAVLRERARATTIGKAAIAKHWFVDDKGPWSTKVEAENDQMKKELNIGDQNEPEPSPSPEQSASPSESPRAQ